LVVFSDGKPGRLPRIEDLPAPKGPAIDVVRNKPAAAPAAEAAEKPAAKGKLSLDGASWVWFKEGDPRTSAPVGTRYFRGTVTVPEGKKVKQARMIATCDNDFVLYVNGKEAGRSDGGDESWRRPQTIDLAKLLVPGANLFAVAATNGAGKSGAANPAGLIGKFEIAFDAGDPIAGSIGESWKSADKEQAAWNTPGFDDKSWPAAMKIAAYGDAPWGKPGEGDGGGGGITRSPVVADIFDGRFAIPADRDLKAARVVLYMDGLPDDSAAVTVNGKYAGGVIGAPTRLDVTGVVKSGENTVRIAPLAPKAARIVIYP
jgi:hypothetical protein